MAANAYEPNNVGGEMRVSISPQTGTARFVWPTNSQSTMIKQKAGANTNVENQARIFFNQYNALFGIKDFDRELVLSKKITDDLGNTHLSFDQFYRDIPVFAGVLRIHFDNRGMISSANGTFIPDIDLDPIPNLSADFATSVAKKDVAKADASPIKTTLYIFRENLARGVPGENHLVYEVENSNDRNIREFIYVDAHTGAIIDRISGVYDLQGQPDDCG